MRSMWTIVAAACSSPIATPSDGRNGDGAAFVDAQAVSGDVCDFEARALGLVDISIDATALSQLITAPLTFQPVTIRIDGKEARVAARLRGYRSFEPINSPDRKPSFRVDLNRFEESPCPGLGHLTLRGESNDRTRLREWLFYGWMRAVGLPAPRVSWVLLSINGASYGVYTNIETEDRAFAARWFANDDGEMYEGELTTFPGPIVEAGAGFDKEMGDAADHSRLLALFAAVDTVVATDASVMPVLAPHVDMQQWLRYWAAETIAGLGDGLSYAAGTAGGLSNNFRLYAPRGGKFSLLPWGADLAFTGGIASLHVRARCHLDAACHAAYLDTYYALREHYLSAGLTSQVDAAADLLRARVASDPRPALAASEWEVAVEELKNFRTPPPVPPEYR